MRSLDRISSRARTGRTNMDETLTIDGQAFQLLGTQRGGASVYRGVGTYLRIGDSETIARDLALHRTMEKARFPVAQIVQEGTLAHRSYFLELSLGDASFRALFEKDIDDASAISAAKFKSFLSVSKQLMGAQTKMADGPWDVEEFAWGVKLTTLCRELPAHADEIRARFVKAAKRLSVLPKTLLHGDNNPANMYQGGVIDLEDSFYGPLGYDQIAALMSIEWSPVRRDYEFYAQYRFSDEQKKEYLKMVDTLGKKAGVAALSEHADDLAFCRALWLCAGMQEWPMTQQWRFEKLIDTYLS